MSVTVATSGGGTETLGVAVYHFGGGLLQQQGPTGGINSITVSPNANDGGLYIAAYYCSNGGLTLSVTVTSPNGTILGLRKVRRSGIWLNCIHRVRRSGVWKEVPRQVRRGGVWKYTTL
jgi:hypothetical protein